jgi:hypothetical protein
MNMAGVEAKFAELTPNHEQTTRQAVYDVLGDLENHPAADLVEPLRN